jgi:spore germination protein YaaH
MWQKAFNAKRAFLAVLCPIALFFTGCSSTLKPDRIEVWHSQQVYDEYEVEEEDSLETIAEKFKMTPERLVELNGLEEPYSVTPGQVLQVDSQDGDSVIVKQIYY